MWVSVKRTNRELLEEREYPQMKKSTCSILSDIYGNWTIEQYDIITYGSLEYSIFMKGMGSTFKSLTFFDFVKKDTCSQSFISKSRSACYGYKLICLPFSVKISILNLYNSTKNSPDSDPVDVNVEFKRIMDSKVPFYGTDELSTDNEEIDPIIKEIDAYNKDYISAIKEYNLISIDIDNRLRPATRKFIIDNYEYCKNLYLTAQDNYLQSNGINTASDGFINALFKPIQEHHVLLHY